MGRKIGKKASKRMQALRTWNMKGRAACHCLPRHIRKRILEWRSKE